MARLDILGYLTDDREYDNKELSMAVEDFKIAWNQFNNADSNFVDAATYKLNASIEHLDALLREVKSNEIS